MSPPLVSVILPVHNRAETILRAVDSVLAQSHAQLELLVVDDASTDGTRAALATVADPRLRVLTLAQNGGPAVARNQGIKQARGEWLAFQDSDDEWLPHKLQAQLAVAGDASLVLCPYALPGPAGPRRIEARMARAGGDIRHDLLDGWPIITPTWLLRRDLPEGLPQFDESLRCLEDWDLILRLGRQRRIVAGPAEVCLHKHASADSVCGDPARMRHALAEILRRHGALWADSPTRRARRLGHLVVLDLACGDRRAARRHALRALRAAPWHPAPWALLAATWGRARWLRACQQRWPLFTGMALPTPAP